MTAAQPLLPGRGPGLSEALFQSSPDCVKLIDSKGGVILFNENGLCVMEIDDPKMVEGLYWPDLWPAESRDIVAGSLKQARSTGSASFVAACPTAKGTPKWWDVVVTALPDGDGDTRFVVASRDITRQRELEAREREAMEQFKAAAARRDALAAELAHRIANTLAVVSGVFQQTLRASPDMDGLSAAFSSRLAAMANANAVLLRGQWAGADLRELAQMQLAPFIDGDRLTIDGPKATLATAVSQSVALALNELATNALKYGALSAPGGSVALSWEILSREAGDVLRIVWTERGGPEVRTPQKSGLGSQLIERGVPDAVVERRFDPQGVSCSIELPAERFAAQQD